MDAELLATLRIYADSLDDLEETRVSMSNRMYALGEEGLKHSFEYASIEEVYNGLKELEHATALNLVRAVRQHPLGPWVKRTTGVGEKQGGRLLATIGDPYWNEGRKDEDGTWIRLPGPRTVGQLWAYCGYHVIEGQAPRRKKGIKSNWSQKAKMRGFLVAESCVKAVGGERVHPKTKQPYTVAASPYRPIYEDERLKHQDALHAFSCVRCGPAGKPAEVGSPLSLSHQHARALRVVAKEVLKDMWIEARALHAGEEE